jgi:hypothetical protein
MPRSSRLPFVTLPRLVITVPDQGPAELAVVLPSTVAIPTR